jgi:protein TonB
MTPTERRWLAPAVLAAVLLNAALFVSAAFLSRERPIVEDLTPPVAVSLVTLPPPETPPPERPREVEPPPREPQLDFVPELAPPSLAGPEPLDVRIDLDPTLFAGEPARGDFVFDGSDLDSPPRAVVRTEPLYAMRLRQRGVEGTVKVKLLVQTDGTVGEVEILASEPAGVFDKAVLQAVPHWRFEPGRIDGRPVRAWVITDVRFEMER